jgi:hypothetical protein
MTLRAELPSVSSLAITRISEIDSDVGPARSIDVNAA